MTHLTTRCGAISIFGAMLAVLGTLIGEYEVIAIGVAIIIYILLTFIPRPKIRVVRETEATKAFEGDETDVYVKVENTGIFPAIIHVYDVISPYMRLISGTNRYLVYLRQREKLEFVYRVECPLRGHYVFGPLMIRRRDRAFLYFDDEKIEKYTYFTVYPHIHELHRVPIKTRFIVPYYGTITTKTAGMGSEFLYIREYIVGDPFKIINWKASMRLRRWMVNQYEKESLCNVLIILDAREITGKGTPLFNPLEFSVKATASLSYHLLRTRNQVGLVTYGSEVKAIFENISPHQFDIILNALVGTYASGNMPMITAIDTILPHILPRSTIVFISPLEDDITIYSCVRMLRDRGHEVIILSPSLVDIEATLYDKNTDKLSMLHLERQNKINELRGLGALVIDWDVKKPLSYVLNLVVEEWMR